MAIVWILQRFFWHIWLTNFKSFSQTIALKIDRNKRAKAQHVHHSPFTHTLLILFFILVNSKFEGVSFLIIKNVPKSGIRYRDSKPQWQGLFHDSRDGINYEPWWCFTCALLDTSFESIVLWPVCRHLHLLVRVLH